MGNYSRPFHSLWYLNVEHVHLGESESWQVTTIGIPKPVLHQSHLTQHHVLHKVSKRQGQTSAWEVSVQVCNCPNVLEEVCIGVQVSQRQTFNKTHSPIEATIRKVGGP